MNIISKIIRYYKYLKEIIINMLRRVLYEEPTYTAPTAKSLTYNGSAQALFNAGSSSHGFFEYSGNGASWSTAITTATSAGTYSCKWRFLGDGSHSNVWETAISGSIAKYTPVAPTANNLIWNGNAQALVNAGSTNFGKIVYSTTSDGTYTETIPTGTNAGSYDVWWKLSGDTTVINNCNNTAATKIVCAINKAPMSYTAPKAVVTIYTGAPQQIVSGYSANGGYIYYATSSDGASSSTTVPTQTNAGTYSTYWKAIPDSNHSGGTNSWILVGGCKINQRPIHIPSPHSTTKQYDGTPATVTFEAAVGAGITKYRYSTDGSTWTESSSNPAQTNAGTLYAQAYYSANDSNYSGANWSSSATITVRPAPCNSTAPRPTAYVYNGSARPLVTPGAATGGTMQYCTTSGGTYSTNIPTQVNAGTYITWWKVANDSNHSGTCSGSVSTTIAKAAMTYTAPKAAVRTYTGNPQQIVSGYSANGGSIYYATSSDGTSSSTTVPTQTNAGTYGTYWRAFPDSNHSGGTNSWALVSGCIINEKNITPTVSISNWTYGGTASNPSVAGNTGGGTVVYYYKLTSASSWSTTKPSNAGNYDIKADISATTNYNSGSCTNTFTISPKTVSSPTITLSPSEYTYSGNPCRPGVTVKDGSTTIPSTEYTVNYSNNVNAGIATVTITDKSGGNYTVSGSKTFTIAKAVPVHSIPTPVTGLSYNEDSQVLINAGAVIGGTMYYSLDSSNWTTDVSSISAINPGTYNVYWKIVGDSNHIDVITNVIQVTIDRADRIVQWPTREEELWPGQVFPIDNVYPDYSWDGTIYYEISNPDAVVLSGNTIIPIEVGYNEVTVGISGGTYYKDASLTHSLPVVPGYLQFVVSQPSQFQLSSATGKMSYSIDSGYTWTELSTATSWTPTVTDSIFFRGTLTPSGSGIGTFNSRLASSTSTKAEFAVKGTPLSLLYGIMFTGYTQSDSSLEGKNSAFYALFKGSKVTDASEMSLPSETLSTSCYKRMFSGCTSLTAVPELPATTLAEACYQEMFAECSSLVDAPSRLPALVIQKGAYGSMFSGCTSMVVAPKMDAISISGGAGYTCYQMFKGCRSMTTAPELKVRTLYTNNYGYMFSGCTNLNYIKALFTTTPSTAVTQNWVSGVAASGTFVKANDATWNVVGVNGVPSGWVAQSAETRVVTTYNVTTTSSPTTISFSGSGIDGTSGFTAIEIDGTTLPSLVTAYTFSTTGQHTVKYTLADPTIITNRAFNTCTNMTSAVIPNTVLTIDNGVFRNCSGLTSLTMSDSVRSFGNNSFQRCYGLTSSEIVIPDSVKTIGDMAYWGCTGATAITIPESVTSIGSQAFYGLTSLQEIHCEGKDGPSINADTFEAVKTNGTVYAPQGSFKYEFMMFDMEHFLGYYDWNLVYIPSVVTAKFNVTSTSSPTQIASGTSNFSKIEIDGVEQPSVTTGYTFSTTGEHTVKYTLIDLTNIGNDAFRGCSNITSIDIPNGVTSISQYAFYNCSGLTSVTIPDGVTSIGRNAFANCSGMTNIDIPSGVTIIGWSAFEGCSSLTNIVIPDSITTIGDNVFCACTGLTSIVIPDSVTYIGEEAFYGCRSLTNVTIGSGVTEIGKYAFQNCSAITSIISNVTIAPDVYNTTFKNVHTNGMLYVPQGSTYYEDWMENSSYFLGYYNWNITSITAIITTKFNVTSTSSPTKIAGGTSVFSKIEIDGVEQPSVTTGYTFSTTGQHTIKYVLSDTTTTGVDAFYNCNNLTMVLIPNGVISIGSNAFYGCTSLTSVTIPDSVTSIGYGAFFNCTSLTSINIPDSVTNIISFAFLNCTNLTSVTIGSGITDIGAGAFSSCSNLTTITSKAITEPTIQSDTFQDVHANGTLYIPMESEGYYVWMGSGNYYLGLYNWDCIWQNM